MGIIKHLKKGEIYINTIEKQIEIADSAIILPYGILKPQDWGLIYEKYVGQVLESEGFEVKYNGLEKGFLDKGIDLIASKDNQLFFIQCKFLNRTMSKSQIDWILYKASNLLHEQFEKHKKKLGFILIVNKKETVFSKRKSKNFRLNFSDIQKVEYPLLQYFLDHNYIQDKIKLECREIEMTK